MYCWRVFLRRFFLCTLQNGAVVVCLGLENLKCKLFISFHHFFVFICIRWYSSCIMCGNSSWIISTYAMNETKRAKTNIFICCRDFLYHLSWMPEPFVCHWKFKAKWDHSCCLHHIEPIMNVIRTKNEGKKELFCIIICTFTCKWIWTHGCDGILWRNVAGLREERMAAKWSSEPYPDRPYGKRFTIFWLKILHRIIKQLFILLAIKWMMQADRDRQFGRRQPPEIIKGYFNWVADNVFVNIFRWKHTHTQCIYGDYQLGFLLWPERERERESAYLRHFRKSKMVACRNQQPKQRAHSQ